MKAPSIEEFKTWAKENQSLALAVCKAQAFAECERERVDSYIRPIFNGFGFTYCGPMAEKMGLKGPLPHPNDLYLCEDEALLTDYWKACDAAHREHGFRGEAGYCPALIAESNHIKIQNGLLRAGCDLFGLEDIPSLPDQRAKMLDLLLGACLIKERKAA